MRYLRIYRSGETGYFINKVQCRLKDILELFMDTGIGKDGYSIIGQGKIDEILSNKSEDRRNVFEEAAGIVKFKTRKEESEKKLERTKLNVLRINDIISEIEGNLEPLKVQSEKAKKYVDLKSELKNIEVGLFVHNIERYKSDLEKTVQDATIIQENCDLEEGKLEKIKIIKEDLKSTIDELTENIEKTQNLGFSSQKEIEMLNSDINVSKTKIQNNEENKERFTQEIEEIKQKIEKSTQDMKLKLSRKDGLKENKEKFEKELEEKTKKLEEINKTLSEKELEIEEDKRKLEENIDTKYEIEGFINEQKVNISNIENPVTGLTNYSFSFFSGMPSHSGWENTVHTYLPLKNTRSMRRMLPTAKGFSQKKHFSVSSCSVMLLYISSSLVYDYNIEKSGRKNLPDLTVLFSVRPKFTSRCRRA